MQTENDDFFIELYEKVIRFHYRVPDNDLSTSYEDHIKQLVACNVPPLFYLTDLQSKELHLNAMRYCAYNLWCEYEGYVNDQDYSDVLEKNIETLRGSELCELLSEFFGLTLDGNVYIGDDNYLLNENTDRFELVNFSTARAILKMHLLDNIFYHIKHWEKIINEELIPAGKVKIRKRGGDE